MADRYYEGVSPKYKALIIITAVLSLYFAVTSIFTWIAWARATAPPELCPPTQLRCTGVCDDGVTPTTVGVQLCKQGSRVRIVVPYFTCDATVGSAATLGPMQCELPAGFRTNSSFGSKQGYFSPNVVHDTDHPWPSTVVQWLIGTDFEAGVPYVQDLDNGKSYLVLGWDLYGGTESVNAIWGPDLGFSIEYTAAN